MTYPVTTEATDHPGGYEGVICDFYDEWAVTLAGHLDAGRDVGVLCEGDPLFYGSYMYLHERLAPRYRTEVVPGVTSFSAAAASAGLPLARRNEVLTILPGTLPVEALASRLATTDAAVVIKLGRNFAKVRDAVERAAAGDRAIYVERASSAEELTSPIGDVDADAVPYMSLVLVPAADGDTRERAGLLDVVGLGPAGPEWLTPEAHAALAAADVLVGYAPVPRARPRAARTGAPRERQPRRARARTGGAGARARRRARGASSPRATPASSPWPQPCTRRSRRAARASRACPCASSRASRRCRPPPRVPARRSATTSASSRCPTSSSHGP